MQFTHGSEPASFPAAAFSGWATAFESTQTNSMNSFELESFTAPGVERRTSRHGGHARLPLRSDYLRINTPPSRRRANTAIGSRPTEVQYAEDHLYSPALTEVTR